MAFDIKKNRGSFLTKAVLLLLALTFVIGFGYAGGISLVGQGPGSGYAVEVNKEKVSLAQFYNLRDSLLKRQRRVNQEITPEVADFINFQAIDILVNRKLLAQKAARMGIRVSDEELSLAIKNDPLFQIDGVFVGEQRYRDYISRALNQTWSEYEEARKEELLAKKIISVIGNSINVTDEELFGLYRMRVEEVNLNYVSFLAENYSKDIRPSEKEILEYYEANSELFVDPEQRKVRYVKVSPEDFASQAKVSEEESRAYYQTYTDEFSSDSGIRPFDEVREDIEEHLVATRSADFYNRFLEEFLNADPSFSDFLEKTGRTDVTETDYFSLEDLGEDVPGSVRRKAFSLEEREFGSIVRRNFAWFFEVTETKPSKPEEISSARERVVKLLKEEKGRKKAKDVAHARLKKIRASRKSFRSAARSMRLKVSRTGFFSRSELPLDITSPEFAADVFTLRKKRPTPDMVYESPLGFHIVSLRKKNPADKGDFESAKDSLRQQRVAKYTNMVIISWLEEMRKNSRITPNKDLFSQRG